MGDGGCRKGQARDALGGQSAARRQGRSAMPERLGALAQSAAASAPAQRLAQMQGLADRGTPLQRMNLEQTKWVGGMEKESVDRAIVGSSVEGHVYREPRSLDATDRTNAMQVLAARNAAIGKTVDNEARTKWGAPNSNAKWTKDDDDRDEDTANTIDPYFYEGLANFKNPDKYGKGQEGTDYVGFMYQHAKNFTGYIEAILDTSNDQAQGVPSMYMPPVKGSSGDKAKALSDDRRNPKFTNIHDTDDNSNLLGMTSSGGGEKNLDAYTKIGGEGSRWVCVREHATGLTNDSWFYTRTGARRGKVWAVSFRTLWLSWASVFDKAYDIPNATVAAKLADGGVGWGVRSDRSRREVAESTLSGKDKSVD